MTRRLFGTDGIRGTANAEPMTAETALKVAMAAGARFRRDHHRAPARSDDRAGNPHHHPLVVIGKDTRLSGYLLEPALTAGFISVGMDVVLVGPMPTPAVAILTRSLRADLGVVISASHNPYQDNGIKLFGPDGFKLSDAVEAEIEQGVDDCPRECLASPDDLGRARRLDDAPGRYIEFVKGTFPRGLRLDGLKIVVDCAHGAAYRVAPTVLWELGADIVALGDEPDGFNINEGCGATAPEAMRRTVLESGADFGLALDGDADRVIIADETGTLIDGDHVMALVAESWQRAGRLTGGGVVATVMSNLGLERYLEGLGLRLVRTQVGDRYVIESMRDNGFNLGGEQSGHIVFSDYTTTGDGLIAALQVLAVLVAGDKPASEVRRMFRPLPQLLRNVRFNGARAPLDDRGVRKAVRDGEVRLGKAGRLVIRPSGTEPVVRVMAEGEDEGLVAHVVDDIVGAIERAAR